MNILVTGGAGFIGGHLAEQFLREGHDVTVLDVMHPYYDLRIKGAHAGHSPRRCGIRGS